MALVAPLDRGRSRPFRIVDGSRSNHARLGGRAPSGVGDAVLSEAAAYVLTVPAAVDPDLYISIFVQGELWDAMNRGMFSDERVVALSHGALPSRTDGRFPSALSEHLLELGEERPDMVAEPGDDVIRPRADHKIGGRPHCIQEPELEGIEALLDTGFVQLVQLDFPSAADAMVRGTWPFANGLFSLFGAPPFERFFWAFQK
jgi:hypothetical protein